MNSAAVWPNSRCSSVRSSRDEHIVGARREVRNCPPPTGVCVWVMVVLVLLRARPSSLTTATVDRRRVDSLRAAEKYKPDNVPTINELFQLTGRVAIVTGGSRGLGQEMAEGLAEAGAALMLCARREEWLTPTVDAMRGARLHASKACSATSSKPADVQAVVDKTIAAFGQVDILVNNAGVTLGRPSPKTMPLDKWQKVVDVNLTGAFLFSQAAGRDMLKRAVRAASSTSRRSPACTRRCNGPHYAAYAATQGRPDGADARAGGVVGRAKASASTRSPRASSTRAWPTRAIAMAEAGDQGDAARFRASATPAS